MLQLPPMLRNPYEPQEPTDMDAAAAMAAPPAYLAQAAEEENNNNNSGIYQQKVSLLGGMRRNRNDNAIPGAAAAPPSDEDNKEEGTEKSTLTKIVESIPNGYDVIDSCGNSFTKVAPYVNKVLGYGWFPFVVWYGLKQGTHKYFPSDDIVLPEGMEDTQLERAPALTDIIPFVGSAGSSSTGLLNTQ